VVHGVNVNDLHADSGGPAPDGFARACLSRSSVTEYTSLSWLAAVFPLWVLLISGYVLIQDRPSRTLSSAAAESSDDWIVRELPSDVKWGNVHVRSNSVPKLGQP
jgi:hypothetical protein